MSTTNSPARPLRGLQVENTLRGLLPGFGLRFADGSSSTHAAIKVTGCRDGIAFEATFTGNTRGHCEAFAAKLRASLR